MSISGIYKIQSKIKPERLYIGSAVGISNRWLCHLKDLRKNKHHSKKLQNHYNKYGESDFQFSILLGCDKEYLIANEQFFIDTYKPYFNICSRAGSRLGVKCSEESLKLMSQSQKGNQNSLGAIRSEETKKKQSESAKNRPPMLEEVRQKQSKRMMGNKYSLGKKASPYTKLKMSEGRKGKKNGFYGKHHSEETRKINSEKHVGFHWTDESKAKAKLTHTGMKDSEETKRKKSEARKRYWLNKKSASTISEVSASKIL